MDLKEALAKGIQQELVKHVPLDKSEPIQELEGPGASIEAHVVTALETQIRVVTVKHRTRYFTVKVTEHI
jgi:hypothetical protein